MILDTLAECDRYTSVHPMFARAFDFLRRPDLILLPPGRHVLDGELLYVSVDHKEARDRERAQLESHRRYIDIQFCFEGEEEIGWMPVPSCAAPIGRFDDERDVIFYDDRPTTWFAMPPGRFAVFFPADAHAPLVGRGLLKKAIVKIAVNQEMR